MTPAPVLLRCSASPRIGMGHLARCREMARYLTERGHVCHLAGPDEAMRQPGDTALFASWTPLPDSDSAQDSAAVIALAGRVGARHLVLDDYRGDLAYQQALQGAGIRWLQQFDSSRDDRFVTPILVNASPFERPAHYAQRVLNPQTRLLFGPRYAVLRPAFADVTVRQDGRPVRRILASFGGGDDRGAIALAVGALADMLGTGLDLCIVSGQSNPRNAELATDLAGRPHVTFLINPPDMAQLIADCDLGIIAGGTMSYELARCGVPMVLVALAPNQVRSCQGWQDLTGTPFAGRLDQLTPDGLRGAVAGLMQDDAMRHDIAAKGRSLVDCNGVKRLCDALLERDGDG